MRRFLTWLLLAAVFVALSFVLILTLVDWFGYDGFFWMHIVLGVLAFIKAPWLVDFSFGDRLGPPDWTTTQRIRRILIALHRVGIAGIIAGSVAIRIYFY